MISLKKRTFRGHEENDEPILTELKLRLKKKSLKKRILNYYFGYRHITKASYK